jgi:hypothetical protein
MDSDLCRVTIVDFVGREVARVHRRLDADFGQPGRNVRGGDGARQALAPFRRRVGNDVDVFQDSPGLQRDQLRIARADAETIKGACHRFGPFSP